MKVLVTGASGFLGSQLVDTLYARGDEVRVLIRPGNIAARQRFQQVAKVFEGDVRELSSLAPAMQRADYVYHLAAKTGPWGNDELYRAINVDGLVNVVLTAVSAGVRRIVYTSSTTIYGHHLQGVITEDAPFFAEDNPYSRSKIVAERLAANLVRDCHAPLVTLRPGWVYGPHDLAGFARLAASLERGRRWIIGAGTNILPLIAAQDLIQALIKAAEADEHVIGRAYNIVNDEWVTQAAYLNAVARALSVAQVSRHLPISLMSSLARTSERIWQTVSPQHTPPLTLYDVSLTSGDFSFSLERARQELQFVPAISLQQGVQECVQWYREYQQGGMKHHQLARVDEELTTPEHEAA